MDAEKPTNKPDLRLIVGDDDPSAALAQRRAAIVERLPAACSECLTLLEAVLARYGA